MHYLESDLILIDQDTYTRELLCSELAQRGFTHVRTAADFLELHAAIEQQHPDIVILNFHSDRPDSLIACNSIRLMSPETRLIVISAPGPAIKQARAWASQTGSIDLVIEKPLSEERFYVVLENLLKSRQLTRQLEEQSNALKNLLPEGALPYLGRSDNEGELFEAAVLFTDIRNSSKLIHEKAPREFFEILNRNLSTQAKLITQYEGSVIKYTGDGVMAIFRGMGRTYLALRCGLALAEISANQEVPYGVGIAEGLVMSGLIGDSNLAGQRRQYDVIGTTVHLAARLCSLANAGEVITTQSINTRAKLETPSIRSIGNVSIRGFDAQVECVAFQPTYQEKP